MTTKKLTSIGSRLRWAREYAGLSQGQVAKMLGLHRPTISQLEADERTVKPDEIIKFAEIYSVKEEWIIKGETADDPRIEVAARELRKLRKEDLDEILNMIRVMRPKEEDKP